MEKFQNGSMTNYRVRDTFIPRTPERIQEIAESHGMPASVCPAYAGDRAMVGRAITANIGRAKTMGWLVAAHTNTKTKVVYTIAAIAKDETRERIDYLHETTLKWEGEVDPTRIEGSHEVARLMNEAYQGLRGLVQAGDFTQHIIDYIKGECRGVAIGGQGGTYWVPPQGTATLQGLRAYLDEIGIGLFIGEIEAESHGDVREVAQGGVSEQIDALKARVFGVEDDQGVRVGGFDGGQTPSVYRRTLTELRELRATAMAYDAAIGISLGEVRGVLQAIEAQTRALLTVRLDTVIHRDGTRETVARPPVDAQTAYILGLVREGEQALARALVEESLGIDADAGEIAAFLAQEEEAEAAPGAVDEALVAALGEAEGLDPALVAALAQPGPASDLPATW